MYVCPPEFMFIKWIKEPEEAEVGSDYTKLELEGAKPRSSAWTELFLTAHPLFLQF